MVVGRAWIIRFEVEAMCKQTILCWGDIEDDWRALPRGRRRPAAR